MTDETPERSPSVETDQPTRRCRAAAAPRARCSRCRRRLGLGYRQADPHRRRPLCRPDAASIRWHSRRAWPTSEFFHDIVPDDQMRVRIAVAGMLPAPKCSPRNTACCGADGGMRWVHAQGRADLDETDAPVRFSGRLVDITEQKRVEEQLRIAQTAGGIGTFEHADGFGTVDGIAASSASCWACTRPRVLPVRDHQRPRTSRRPADHRARSAARQAGRRTAHRVAHHAAPTPASSAGWRAAASTSGTDRAGLRFIGVIYDITDAKQHRGSAARS